MVVTDSMRRRLRKELPKQGFASMGQQWFHSKSKCGIRMQHLVGFLEDAEGLGTLEDLPRALCDTGLLVQEFQVHGLWQPIRAVLSSLLET